ncbi:MAG: ABC transporter transmembrane domain-containing protein [Lamprobacter sp.]|uniref:ABC transporter transmembrane domain-containing protein n=1 Tax=Lamprobacter sp. TaxID=3100796 RepID=UPI002B25C545|nr:ABC transporter transmembrane domain-containing protein [Lamprobacter sp.]MEA3642081.1 ABC transporter transmembrane domain-containing protein [Lamprobacter sp.]
MIDLAIWKKAWALLDTRERRNAWITLSVVILCALSSALMVGSVLPFLSVLADPGQIERVPALAWAYETFGFSSDYAFLVALGVASFVVIVLTSLVQIANTYVVSRFATMRMHSISHRLLSAYLRQPYAFFLNRHSGEMGTRVLAESQQLVGQFLKPAADLIASAFTVSAIVGLLLWVEPLVALIAFATLGGIYGAVYALSRRLLKRFGYARVQANSERFRIANEALGGIKDIKLLGRERAYAARYAVPSLRMARAMLVAQVIAQLPQYVLQAVAFGGIILLCLLMLGPQGLASGEAMGGFCRYSACSPLPGSG